MPDKDRVEYTVLEFDDLTEDEVIAKALEMCPVGESIEIHEPGCMIGESADCTCTPRALKKGATA